MCVAVARFYYITYMYRMNLTCNLLCNKRETYKNNKCASAEPMSWCGVIWATAYDNGITQHGLWFTYDHKNEDSKRYLQESNFITWNTAAKTSDFSRKSWIRIGVRTHDFCSLTAGMFEYWELVRVSTNLPQLHFSGLMTALLKTCEAETRCILTNTYYKTITSGVFYESIYSHQ